MTAESLVAYAAALVLAALVVFQLALAAGAPLAKFAWGGRYEGRLPGKLRASSVASALVLAFAAWMILARADVLAPGPDPLWVRGAVWVFAGFFVLNTIGNMTSMSPSERYTMTPLTILLVISFVVVAV